MKIRVHQIGIVLMVTLMAVLSLQNIDNRYLWYDEAHTALIGRNVLKYGIPKVWDGKYLVTTSNGNDFDNHLWIVKDGYVQYYLAAFGEIISQWCHPRVVFVLLGVAGSVIMYLLTKQMVNNIKISLLSMFIYCTSVPIILYIRQVRYYAPAIFFSLLIMLAYFLAIKYNTNQCWLFFSISAILLYHTLYLYFWVIIISLCLKYLFFDKSKQNIKKVLISLFIIFVCTFPFFVHAQIFLKSVGDRRSRFQGWYYFILQIPGYLSQINAYFFPFFSISIIYGFVKIINKIFVVKKSALLNDDLKQVKRKNINPNTFFIITIIIVNVIIVSAFSVQYATRYLLPSILMSNILCAITISAFFREDQIVGFILTIIMLFTNCLGVAPYMLLKRVNQNVINTVDIIVKPPVPYFIAQGNFVSVDTLETYLENKIRYTSYFKNYLLEITTDYNDAIEGVVKFLIVNANKEDVVEADDFLSDSIAYYTKLRVVNRLNHVGNKDDFWYSVYNKLPNVEKYLYLTYYPDELVKWKVVLPNSKQEVEYIKSNIDTSLYEIIEITGYPNAMFAADIWEHSFTTDYSYPSAIIIRNKSVP